jgi:hypothetical protein
MDLATGLAALSVFVVLPLALIALLAYRRRVWLALGARAGDSGVPGRSPHGDSMVHGVIQQPEAADNAATPILTMEIDQSMFPVSAGSARWDETASRVEVTPFVLRTDSGEAVLVAPDPKHVRLVCALDGLVRHGVARRTRSVVLRVGDRISVIGALERAADSSGGPFRDQPALATLRAPSHRPLVITTRAVGAMYREHATWLRGQMIGVAYLTAGLHALLLWPLYMTSIEVLLQLAGVDAGHWLATSWVSHATKWIIAFALLLKAGDTLKRRPWHEQRKLVDLERAS